MADACRRIEPFTKGRERSDYLSDEMLRSAIERQILIVGEALGKALQTDPSLETAIPEARAAIGMRNRLAHAYEDTDDELVWGVAVRDVPALRTKAEAELG